LSAAAKPDWPSPIVVLNEAGHSDIVLICEHASNHMPAEYAGLGLPPQELLRHIAWDIGAEAVARGLSARLDAPCFLGTCSRLLIDLNRPLDSPTSILVRSESTDIPGNAALSDEERRRRVEQVFTPFHTRVAAHLDARDQRRKKTRIVAIHSFTPVFLGNVRPWHASVLFGRSRDFASTIIDRLARDAALTIGANQPYVIDRMEDYAIPVHGEDRGYPAILVEIRQDLIGAEAGIAEWTERLAAALAGEYSPPSQMPID
jgi:predicted N-formylglutamate amidohydrolase